MNMFSNHKRQTNKRDLSDSLKERYLRPRVVLFIILFFIFSFECLQYPQPSYADFTIVVYPDTHVRADTTNLSIWQAQNSWVVNNLSTLNIVAVLGVGDIVNSPSVAGYSNATTIGYDLIDNSGLPYLPLVGNHDYDNLHLRTTSIYDAFFGPTRFTSKSWYLGGHPAGSNANLAIKFDADSRKYLILGLEFFPQESTVIWAQGVIDANPDREVIVVTHAYLTKEGTLYQDSDTYGPALYGLTQDYSGQELWDNFIKLNPSIFLVIGGHDICSPNNAHLISSGTTGNIVSQIQCNYQCHPNGGDGYILLLNIKPAQKVIEVTPYSTNLAINDPNYAPYVLPYNPSQPTITSVYTDTFPPAGISLHATINDNGALTDVSFEYGLTTSYGTTVAAGTVNAGSGSRGVSAEVAGLLPGATYHARAIASNIAGTAISNDVSFSVPIPPPTWPLSLTVTGSGGGIIYFMPAGIACYNSCYMEPIENSTVNLIAVPDSFSVFSGWSGDCSGLDCSFTMDGAKSVNAIFSVPPVMAGTNPYQNLQDAFNATSTGATIKTLAIEFNENLILNRDISISLDGGYDGSYINNAGMTTVKGSLTIESGTITINQFDLR